MLPPAFYTELKPIFQKLTNDEMLRKCQAGLTQNANESLHNILWSKCPKNFFCGKERINFAINDALEVFTTGAASKILILEAAGIEQICRNTYRSLRKEDRWRFTSSAQKVSKRYKIARIESKKKVSKAVQSSRVWF